MNIAVTLLTHIMDACLRFANVIAICIGILTGLCVTMLHWYAIDSSWIAHFIPLLVGVVTGGVAYLVSYIALFIVTVLLLLLVTLISSSSGSRES